MLSLILIQLLSSLLHIDRVVKETVSEYLKMKTEYTEQSENLSAKERKIMELKNEKF